jgi:regulator of protease activity HflC (stomatin/prohibitin superfamily)
MEKIFNPTNGYLALLISLVLTVIAVVCISLFAADKEPWMIISAIISFLSACVLWSGIIVVSPNHARVLTFFGKYVGTVRENGLLFVNPLFTKEKISLRSQNLESQPLKVNDKMGNPIEIGAVCVWQVHDTFKAIFDVDDYLHFVKVQSEAAIRHLATTCPYDHMEDEHAQITLRDGGDKVNHLLEEELNERLSAAGIKVLEARISHLAYAPEIAGAMLQRQQATAIVSARTKIVEGAVGMVELALKELEAKGILLEDNDKKASMVSNLMVVLCSDRSVQPVVNTGTLYS